MKWGNDVRDRVILALGVQTCENWSSHGGTGSRRRYTGASYRVGGPDVEEAVGECANVYRAVEAVTAAGPN